MTKYIIGEIFSSNPSDQTVVVMHILELFLECTCLSYCNGDGGTIFGLDRQVLNKIFGKTFWVTFHIENSDILGR